VSPILLSLPPYQVSLPIVFTLKVITFLFITITPN